MVNIRELKTSEVDALLTLAESIFIPTYVALFPEPEVRHLFKGMFSREILNECIASKTKDLFLAEEELGPVGFFLIIHKETITRIDKIYVHRKMQGKGIGMSLLGVIEERTLAKGNKFLELNVNQGNRAAIQFYLNQGFEIEREETFHAPNGVDYQDFVLKKGL